MRWSDLESFVRAGLEDRGYASAQPDTNEQSRTMPPLDPGPLTITKLLDRYKSCALFLQLGNGAGLTTEELYDRLFITVRVIGMQGNYDYAETLAADVDDLLLAVGSNTMIGSAKVLYITRTGGAPQLVDFDAGNRYHFQATYITEAMR